DLRTCACRATPDRRSGGRDRGRTLQALTNRLRRLQPADQIVIRCAFLPDAWVAERVIMDM
ncbi:hypothetical protein RZS08_56655, partial [Arthrospira platensis SPKY1]|nr:hypothetical protein [Arthrospira platensis SPKY1]